MAERRMITIAQLNFFSGRYFVCEYSQTILVITITVITNSMAITNNILLYIVGPYWLFYYINLHGYNDVTVMGANTDSLVEFVRTESDCS